MSNLTRKPQLASVFCVIGGTIEFKYRNGSGKGGLSPLCESGGSRSFAARVHRNVAKRRSGHSRTIFLTSIIVYEDWNRCSICSDTLAHRITVTSGIQNSYRTVFDKASGFARCGKQALHLHIFAVLVRLYSGQVFFR